MIKKLLFILLAITIINCNNYYENGYTEMMDSMRATAQPQIDEMMAQINRENRFRDSVNWMLSIGQIDGAEHAIDLILARNPLDEYYLTLKGEVFRARKHYDSALYYYSLSIRRIPSPFPLSKRAKVFLVLKKYKEAIQDYEQAYIDNSDYSYPLAKTFELDKQKDSALKYYKIYLTRHPDSVNVSNKIRLLEK